MTDDDRADWGGWKTILQFTFGALVVIAVFNLIQFGTVMPNEPAAPDAARCVYTGVGQWDCEPVD